MELSVDLSIILGAVGTIPILVYIINRLFFGPEVFVRIGGEQSGIPINVLKEGRIIFGVGTRSESLIDVHSVRVHGNGFAISFKPTKGAENTLEVDNDYPSVIAFDAPKSLKKGHLQGFYVNYKSHGDEFELKLLVSAVINNSYLPPLIDMINPKTHIFKRIVRFRVCENPGNVNETGLQLLPGESLYVNGPQASDTVQAQSDKPGATLQVMENYTGKPIYEP